MDVILNPLIIPVGLAIGILVAAPVGPVNILCIQRSIERGAIAGIAAGLGAVLGDGLIALCAALGVGAISGLVDLHRVPIQVVGGIVLMMFGWRLYLTKPVLNGDADSSQDTFSYWDYLWDIIKSFVLTVTNPGAVLGLFAIFGGISSFVEVRGYGEALLVVASIMVGSLLWWITIANIAGRVRHRFNRENLKTINRIAGILLIGFGVVLVGEIIWLMFKGALLPAS